MWWAGILFRHGRASEATPFFERLCPAMTVRWLCESGLGLEIDRLRPLAGFDLLAVGGLHAGDFEAPIGADHSEAVGFDHGDFADLACDPLRVFRRQRLGVEYFELLAVERGPGAGRRMAAADEAVDLLPRLAPVDPGIVGTAAAFVGGLSLILLEA